jgi:hypothetical protein
MTTKCIVLPRYTSFEMSWNILNWTLYVMHWPVSIYSVILATLRKVSINFGFQIFIALSFPRVIVSQFWKAIELAEKTEKQKRHFKRVIYSTRIYIFRYILNNCPMQIGLQWFVTNVLSVSENGKMWIPTYHMIVQNKQQNMWVFASLGFTRIFRVDCKNQRIKF